MCATGAWGFQELGVLEGGQERKPPGALSGILKQPYLTPPLPKFFFNGFTLISDTIKISSRMAEISQLAEDLEPCVI